MERKNYIFAIDLGSSQVTVAVAEKNPEGLLDVVCTVQKPVEGVKAGMIENIEQVGQAIREAVSEVETQMGIHVEEAYAGISGNFVRCARHTDHVFVYDPQNGINQKDVDGLFDRMRNVQAPDDEIIMERVPQNYMVDDHQEVKNPVGSFGKKLSSTFNFVLCLKTPIQRLDMALRRLGIKMLGTLPNALVTPEAVLTPDEKEEGVAVVDIGSGVTDVTVYYRNVVRYVVSIPMGASAINRDIRTMCVPEKYVESFKQKYGSAVAELAPEKLIRVTGPAREAKDILLCNLATVIEARATDIAEFVLQEIRDSGYAGKLVYGIVLTGGSAKLKDLDELFRRVTGMEVRVALPDVAVSENSKEKIADPSFATIVGLLLRGAELGTSSVMVERPVVKPENKQPVVTPPATGIVVNTPSGNMSSENKSSSVVNPFVRQQGIPQPSVPASSSVATPRTTQSTPPTVQQPTAVDNSDREKDLSLADGDTDQPVKKSGKGGFGLRIEKVLRTLSDKFNAQQSDDEEI